MRTVYKVISGAIICLSGLTSFSQTDSAGFFHSLLLDAKYEATAPLTWKSSQWITAASVTSLGAFLIFSPADKNIQFFSQRNRNTATDFLEHTVGDPMGSGLYPAIIVGSAYLSGCLFHRERFRRFALLTVKSLLMSAAASALVKSAAERHRPYQDNPPNPLRWDGPVGMFSYNSFPSGHTTVAFSLASMTALEFQRPAVIPVLAYSIAAVTAWGRINGNYHWSSDVVMGAAIGYFTSRLIYNRNNGRKTSPHGNAPATEE